MSISTGTIKQDLDELTTDQLQQGIDFIAFLKFQSKRRRLLLNPEQLAPLATELAEAGINDYADMLRREDEP
ncbi:hypothetical protein N836_01575 [Leptolyngbya sp. Heron Island J]|uniref:hypothetical protein n=1 Tax=Leptolyngbya sp. Heron Island J TaxID=1385935 RepID=UPI0003B940E4|nr:hypothetical protein [Leptolyngbya sp. Heron Island J]ESA33485.1 hypothetical protein N836_01575 [Leptolyngbya sp. Heron Island J]